MSDRTQAEIINDLGEAVAMVSCPYYQGAGTCHSGCYSEPQCQACTPLEGWEQHIADLGAELATASQGQKDTLGESADD